MSDPRCAKCGHPRSNHPYRHPFVGPSLEDDVKALTAKVKLMDDLDAINGEKIEALTAKLATCEKYRDAYAEMGRIGTQAVRDLEAKLAKAVEVLERCEIMLRLRGHDEVAAIARATLVEIKGESHE